MSWERLDLNLINGGRAVSDVNHHLQKAVEDALDMNKPATKARVVTLEIKLLPTDDREKAAIEYSVKTKFPHDSVGIEAIGIKRETKQGFINTDEQLHMDFDPETGEVSTLIRKEGNK